CWLVLLAPDCYCRRNQCVFFQGGISPGEVVTPDIAHFDRPAFRVRWRIGQATSLKTLHQNIGLHTADAYLDPVGLGDRQTGDKEGWLKQPADSQHIVLIEHS